MNALRLVYAVCRIVDDRQSSLQIALGSLDYWYHLGQGYHDFPHLLRPFEWRFPLMLGPHHQSSCFSGHLLEAENVIHDSGSLEKLAFDAPGLGSVTRTATRTHQIASLMGLGSYCCMGPDNPADVVDLQIFHFLSFFVNNVIEALQVQHTMDHPWRQWAGGCPVLASCSTTGADNESPSKGISFPGGSSRGRHWWPSCSYAGKCH